MLLNSHANGFFERNVRGKISRSIGNASILVSLRYSSPVSFQLSGRMSSYLILYDCCSLLISPLLEHCEKDVRYYHTEVLSGSFTPQHPQRWPGFPSTAFPFPSCTLALPGAQHPSPPPTPPPTAGNGPIATDDTFTTIEDAVLQGNLSSNDILGRVELYAGHPLDRQTSRQRSAGIHSFTGTQQLRPPSPTRLSYIPPWS